MVRTVILSFVNIEEFSLNDLAVEGTLNTTNQTNQTSSEGQLIDKMANTLIKVCLQGKK